MSTNEEMIQSRSRSRSTTWRRVTLEVPERLATFMERVPHWNWLAAHIVFVRSETARELVSMVKLAEQILEKGPMTCAKGHLDFGELARLRKELEKEVRTLYRTINRIAVETRIRLPKLLASEENSNGNSKNH